MEKQASMTRAVTEVFVDPVCGMNVPINMTDLVAAYQGCNYHFCAEGCRNAFEANPAKYLKPKKKGFWARYLDRLNKATEGKPMKCH